MTIGWSTDFIVVDGDLPALVELPRIDAARAGWVVVVCKGGRCYVLRRDELFERLRRTRVPYVPGTKRHLIDVLELRETPLSGRIAGDVEPPVIDLSRRSRTSSPTAHRYARFAARGNDVVSIGGLDVQVASLARAAPPSRPDRGAGAAPPADAVAPAPAQPRTRGVTLQQPFQQQQQQQQQLPPTRGAPTQSQARAPNVALPDDDEGTTPVRHPSIEPVGPVAPGGRVVLNVDLLRTAAAPTSGGPLELGEQAADWTAIELGVTLVSASIDFDHHGRGKVTIRRNGATTAAQMEGDVLDDVEPGSEIEVHAQFWHGTRCCGSAVRLLAVGAAANAPVAAPGTAPGSSPVVGSLRVEPAAEPPDLTIYIALFDPKSPGRLHWRMVTAPFDGLPPQLDGSINLGKNPAAEAAKMFKQFANLERGKHRARIEGFGERLWERAPAEFRAVYWALHDHYQRPLVIQFVSDDPHLPWELMRPYRDGETHPTLALRHVVGRWIGRWNGYMRNRLAAGRMVTIAPKYASASTRLSLAETTAAGLVATFGAEAIEGTRKGMQGLLETPTGKAIALLYFTGHGAFDADAAAASAIKLQDGNLTVDEVGRREVTLGERDGTLVFFNACEVGATASALGTVGGWADAFLSRRFRAFIAPLWAIDEEDAAQVTKELMTRIATERVPVGTALRDVRAKYGDVSPTFFSYLLFGDATARLDAAA